MLVIGKCKLTFSELIQILGPLLRNIRQNYENKIRFKALKETHVSEGNLKLKLYYPIVNLP